MVVLLLFLTIITVHGEKAVEVRFTEISPRIDGVIEKVWQQADSAYGFVQHIPYEKSEPTEKTVAYVLEDRGNLYFAFRCNAQNHKPMVNATGDEDYVMVKIDPFGSKTTGYYFYVFASGIIWDGWLHDDGRTQDDSWEGVWYRAVKVYDDHFDVEIKIPFKSIRYKKKLDAWNVQFVRHITFSQEDDYWTEVLQVEGDLISKWGSLTGINPHASGYYFELFPEAYVRYDRDDVRDSSEFKPRLSLNAKWDVTPQTAINATIYPDFAHIESDPFTLNLDRYPTYLDERRPFFLEGKDIFRMSDFGPGKRFFEPLNIFYSRRIGRSMDGDAVPIIAGLKLTNKSEVWNVGTLGSYTDEYGEDNDVTEPQRWFGVLRAKHRIFENSDIGLMLSGTTITQENYNYAVGVDGVYRRGASQLIIQGAVSNKNEKKGFALSSGYLGFIGNLWTMSALEVVHDSFDVSDIGFAPWSGREKFTFYSGPYATYSKGFVRTLHVAAGVKAVKEGGYDNWSKLGVLLFSPTFRNNWSTSLQFLVGPYYEADTNYLRREVLLSIGGNLFNHIFNLECNYSYTYNYWRGYLGYRGYNTLFYNYSIIPQINPGLRVNVWIEWDTLNTVVAVTPRLRPYILFQITADIQLEAFSEVVIETPGTDFGETELLSNRFGLLFAWRFLPKSWLYIALNDYREQDEQGSLQPQYRIGAIKAKYLVYF